MQMKGTRMVGAGTTQDTTGLVGTVKNNMSVDGIVNQIAQSKDMLLEIGMYSLIGFAIGYLLKRYSGFIFTLALVIVLLIVLNQFQFVAVVINWNKLYEYIGVQPALVNTDNIMTIAWEWARLNMVIVSSAVIGFLIGLRVG